MTRSSAPHPNLVDQALFPRKCSSFFVPKFDASAVFVGLVPVNPLPPNSSMAGRAGTRRNFFPCCVFSNFSVFYPKPYGCCSLPLISHPFSRDVQTFFIFIPDLCFGVSGIIVDGRPFFFSILDPDTLFPSSPSPLVIEIWLVHSGYSTRPREALQREVGFSLPQATVFPIFFETKFLISNKIVFNKFSFCLLKQI